MCCKITDQMSIFHKFQIAKQKINNSKQICNWKEFLCNSSTLWFHSLEMERKSIRKIAALFPIIPQMLTICLNMYNSWIQQIHVIDYGFNNKQLISWQISGKSVNKTKLLAGILICNHFCCSFFFNFLPRKSE